MVLKSLDLRFVYKAAAMILSIKSPDAMPLDRSATADRLSPCPNSLFAIARHPGRRSTSSQVVLAGTQFHDRSAVDQDLYARRHAHPQSTICAVKNPSTVRRTHVDAYLALQAADRHDDAGIGDVRPIGGGLPLQAAVSGSGKYAENRKGRR